MNCNSVTFILLGSLLHQLLQLVNGNIYCTCKLLLLLYPFNGLFQDNLGKPASER